MFSNLSVLWNPTWFLHEYSWRVRGSFNIKYIDILRRTTHLNLLYLKFEIGIGAIENLLNKAHLGVIQSEWKQMLIRYKYHINDDDDDDDVNDDDNDDDGDDNDDDYVNDDDNDEDGDDVGPRMVSIGSLQRRQTAAGLKITKRAKRGQKKKNNSNDDDDDDDDHDQWR